jgi:hypothetical protein
MNISNLPVCDPPHDYGPGVTIELSGDEVAIAIDAFLVANGVYTRGPRTVTVNGQLCESGRVYVDPSGDVVRDGFLYSGRGHRGS